MPRHEAHGIALEYEDIGDKAVPPLMLVKCLVEQLTLWPVELVEAQAARGSASSATTTAISGCATRWGARAWAG